MGSLIGSCVGGCCASVACGACKDCNNNYGPISRLPYIFIFFIAGVFSIIMSLYGEKEINFGFVKTGICQTDSCRGNGSVFRTSFILFVFELLHVFIIGCGAIKFHNSFFIIKVLLVITGITLSFIIEPSKSDKFFDGWSNAARYFSAIYLILQLLILITLGYDINENLQEKMNEAGKDDVSQDVDPEEHKQSCNLYALLMVGVSFGLYIFDIVFLIVFYRWYGGPGCKSHKSFITTTIILVLITAVLSVTIVRGNFFTSAIINTYATFLLWVGLQADPDPDCNIFSEKRGTVSLWMGFIVTFIALFYAALRANLLGTLAWREEEIDDDDEERPSNKDDTMKSPLLDKNNDNDEANVQKKRKNSNEYGSNYDDADIDGARVRVPTDVENSKTNDNESSTDVVKMKHRKQNTYFHIIMTLAAPYFAMVFTNWGANDNLSTLGKNGMWVNMITQWVCFGLFWWTMIIAKIRG